jgi:hypothetical protein
MMMILLNKREREALERQRGGGGGSYREGGGMDIEFEGISILEELWSNSARARLHAE